MTLAPLIESVYAMKDVCEIDPSRCESPEIAQRNSTLILGLIKNLWSTLQSTIDLFPKEIIEVFAEIKNQVTLKFPSDPDVKFGAISGFLFLRFFNPSTISVIN